MKSSAMIITLFFMMFFVLIIVGVVCLIVFAATSSTRKNGNYRNRQLKNVIQQQPPIIPYQQQMPMQAQVQVPERVRIYQRKNLLTKNEYIFYKNLKNFADKYNLHILSKIRMADIVEPKSNANRSEWYSDFGKIKSKHVDFALASKDNLYILCLIELDDNSHAKQDRMERDKFIDQVYQSVGIPIIHTNYYNEQTEIQLRYALGISIEEQK